MSMKKRRASTVFSSFILGRIILGFRKFRGKGTSLSVGPTSLVEGVKSRPILDEIA